MRKVECGQDAILHLKQNSGQNFTEIFNILTGEKFLLKGFFGNDEEYDDYGEEIVNDIPIKELPVMQEEAQIDIF